jgi:hypothetical protein
MKTKFKIFMMALALGTATTFLSCSDDDDDPCAGLTGADLVNCQDLNNTGT